MVVGGIELEDQPPGMERGAEKAGKDEGLQRESKAGEKDSASAGSDAAAGSSGRNVRDSAMVPPPALSSKVRASMNHPGALVQGSELEKDGAKTGKGGASADASSSSSSSSVPNPDGSSALSASASSAGTGSGEEK